MVVCASNAPELYSKQLVSYTSKHRKHHNTPNTAKNTKTLYIRPETSKTAFPTVTKEPLGAKFEFQISKVVVCASNAPELYSKQLVSYTSKHRKHHNTPNIAKHTKTPVLVCV
jgi:ribosomal protein L30E